MRECEFLLRFVSTLSVLGAFGFALFGALLADVDPFWAILRAVAAASALLLVCAVAFRVLPAVFGLSEAEPEPAPVQDGRPQRKAGD